MNPGGGRKALPVGTDEVVSGIPSKPERAPPLFLKLLPPPSGSEVSGTISFCPPLGRLPLPSPGNIRRFGFPGPVDAGPLPPRIRPPPESGNLLRAATTALGRLLVVDPLAHGHLGRFESMVAVCAYFNIPMCGSQRFDGSRACMLPKHAPAKIGRRIDWIRKCKSAQTHLCSQAQTLIESELLSLQHNAFARCSRSHALIPNLWCMYLRA